MGPREEPGCGSGDSRQSHACGDFLPHGVGTLWARRSWRRRDTARYAGRPHELPHPAAGPSGIARANGAGTRDGARSRGRRQYPRAAALHSAAVDGFCGTAASAFKHPDRPHPLNRNPCDAFRRSAFEQVPAAHRVGDVLQVANKICEGNTERARECSEGVQTGIPTSPFNSAHVGPVQTRPLRQLLLGQTTMLSELANATSQPETKILHWQLSSGSATRLDIADRLY